MTHGLRKFALTVHLTVSVGWIGAVIAYLALSIVGMTSQNALTGRAVWIAMELIGWFVIVPLALASLLTGLVMSLGTKWGLFQHYWTLITFVLTILATTILLLHMPTVSFLADIATEADDATFRMLGGDLLHPSAGLLLLFVILWLNVYKPKGLTPYGRRTIQQKRKHSLR